MSRTADVLGRARLTAAPVLGQMTLALVARRGVTRTATQAWATALRQAATILEELAS